jgi:purine-binding chemotaxis protein CheW
MDLPAPPTQTLAPAGAASHAAYPSRVCLITLSGGLFALDLRSVREVFPVESITPVPGMPSVLSGVTNLRGVVVPLVDVRSLLGLSTAGAPQKIGVVIRHGANQVGVLVDQVPEIRTVQQDQFLPAPMTGETDAQSFVSTILRIEDRMGGLLEVPTLLAHMDAGGAPSGNT